MKTVFALLALVISIASFSNQASATTQVEGKGMSQCTFPNGTCTMHQRRNAHVGDKQSAALQAAASAIKECGRLQGFVATAPVETHSNCAKDFNAGVITCTVSIVIDCATK